MLACGITFLPGWIKEKQQTGAQANLRNVWKIATHSFKEAHFATFPPKLVEPCIKAGTSEKGCCAECGASVGEGYRESRSRMGWEPVRRNVPWR